MRPARRSPDTVDHGRYALPSVERERPDRHAGRLKRPYPLTEHLPSDPDMRNDLRLAFRLLRRWPHTAALAALTLSLGIAATVGIFTVIRGVLLRDLPYPDPVDLVLVWRGSTNEPDGRGALSPPDVADIREQSTSLRNVAAVNSFSMTYVPNDGDPEQVQLGVLFGEPLATLGARPLLGRLLTTGDDRPIEPRDSATVGLLVLAHDFWQTRFAGDSNVVGRTIRMGGSRMQIVGVLQEGFALHMPAGAGMSTDLIGWTPLGVDWVGDPRDGAYLKVIARLAGGVGISQAQAELDGIAVRLRDRFPVHRDAGFQLRVVSMRGDVVAHVRPILLLLAGCGIVVLLVACANTASLLLQRFLGRQHEVAVRSALGAERAQIARQLLVEAALITAIGTAAGTVLAIPVVDILLRLEPGIVPRTGAIGIDGGIWLLTVGMTAACTLLAGLLPALLATRGMAAPQLRSARTTTPAAGLRRALIVAQVGAAFVLLYGGAAVLDTLSRMQRADLGFEPEQARTFRITLPFANYQGPNAWVTFFSALEQRLASMSGTVSVGLTSDLPMAGMQSLENWAPTGDTRPWGARAALHRIVSPGYFQASEIAIREGRDFSPVDRTGSIPIAILDETLARRLQQESPGPLIGRQIDITAHEFDAGYQVTRRTAEVVGVVGTVAHEHPAAESPGMIYMPLAQHPLWSMAIVMRGSGASMASAREVVGAMDPDLPLIEPRLLSAVVDDVLAPTRFVLVLTASFATSAIALAAVGLYGLLADGVRQRRRELGIRLAIGATPLVLGGTVLRGGLVLVALGLVPGIIVVPAATRAIGRAVVAVGEVNASAVGLAAVAVLFVALAACYGPARRAGRVNPLSVLRDE